MPRSRFGRQMTAVLAGVGVWLLGWAGVLSLVDGQLHDLLAWMAAGSSRETSRVLLVEVDERAPDARPRRVVELAQELRRLGARRVLFAFTPAGLDRDGFADLARVPAVALGLPLVGDPYDPTVLRLSPVPPAARGLGLEFGVVHVDPASSGVHREKRTRYEFDRGTFPEDEVGERTDDLVVVPALETLALDRDRDLELRERPASCLVSFSGGEDGLLLVDDDSVLRGDVARGIVSGRVALIGRSRRDGDRLICTSAVGRGRTMGTLQFHGHVLNTLLEGGERWVSSRLSSLAIIVVCCVCMGTMLLWADALLAGWIVVSAGLLMAVAAHIGLVFAGVWLPLAEMLLALVLLHIVSMRSKAILAARLARGVLVSQGASAAPGRAGRDDEPAADHWSLVVNMVNQTLDLSRVVFLETVPSSTLLKEARALNCSFQDISERRRDYKRAPYITAMETGSVIRVDNYLKRSFEREEQYLVALSHGGEVLGFWAFGIDPSRISSPATFEAIVSQYSELIGELLQHRRRIGKGAGLMGRVEGFLTRDRTEDLYHELAEAFDSFAGRLEQLEALLAGIQTAAVVYDLFGRVLHVNDRMLEILESERRNPHKMTAVDLVSALSEYDLGKSRTILRHVIVDQQVIDLPVTLERSQKGRYVMHLHPLEVASGPEYGPKDLTGRCILCELVDTTAFTGLYEMKERLANRLGLQLRNDLASIDLSSSLLAATNISDHQRHHISQIIHDKVAKTMDVLVECQQYLTMDGELENVERFPVDAQEALAAALAEVEPALAGRSIRSRVRQPKLMSYVLASADNLKTAFAAILRLLGGDALDGSMVEVVVDEHEDLVEFAFRNTGFGIPNERFQEYVLGDKTLASGDLKVLRESMHWVESWGGELEASSEVGVGTEARLRLVKFI